MKSFKLLFILCLMICSSCQFTKEKRFNSAIDKATKEMESGSFSDAVELYTKAASIFPDDSMIYFLRAKAHLSVAKFPQNKSSLKNAENDFLKHLSLVSDTLDAYKRIANTYASFNHYAKAIKYYSYIILSDKKNASALTKRAVCKYMCSDFSGALIDVNASMNIDSSSAECYFLRAIIQAKKLDYQNAFAVSLHISDNTDDKRSFYPSIKMSALPVKSNQTASSHIFPNLLFPLCQNKQGYDALKPQQLTSHSFINGSQSLLKLILSLFVNTASANTNENNLYKNYPVSPIHPNQLCPLTINPDISLTPTYGLIMKIPKPVEDENRTQNSNWDKSKLQKDLNTDYAEIPVHFLYDEGYLTFDPSLGLTPTTKGIKYGVDMRKVHIGEDKYQGFIDSEMKEVLDKRYADGVLKVEKEESNTYAFGGSIDNDKDKMGYIERERKEAKKEARLTAEWDRQRKENRIRKDNAGTESTLDNSDAVFSCSASIEKFYPATYFDNPKKDLKKCIALRPDFIYAEFFHAVLSFLTDDFSSACQSMSYCGENGIEAAYSYIQKYCNK